MGGFGSKRVVRKLEKISFNMNKGSQISVFDFLTGINQLDSIKKLSDKDSKRILKMPLQVKYDEKHKKISVLLDDDAWINFYTE